MGQISRQILFQRLRNRVIELLEMHASLDDISSFGAFSMVNMIGDWLPLDYDEAPRVFSEQEQEALAVFMELADSAADVTTENTCDIDYFSKSEEWVLLSKHAKQALAVFAKRGRFSEETEEDFPCSN